MIERLVIQTGLKYTSDGYKDRTDTTFYKFEYQENQLKKEIISSPEFGKIVMEYNWTDEVITNIERTKNSDSSITNYSFEYWNKKLKLRKSVSSIAALYNKSNEFVYEDDKLMEITNTWMLANDSTFNHVLFSSEEEKEHMSDILNTKFTYNDSGLLMSLQRVYGMWPGESFWITQYRYHKDGLIKEKELNNDNVEICKLPQKLDSLKM